MARSIATWRPGCPSPNPGGRPKIVGTVRDLAREHTADALLTLAAIMKDPNEPAAARVAAAQAILDRACGRPIQGQVVMALDGSPETADVRSWTTLELENFLYTRANIPANE